MYTYRSLPFTFYQQDEWQIIGHNFAQGLGNITHYTSWFKLVFGEGRPLIRAVNLIFFGYFRFTNGPIGVFAIFCQLFNVWLVYYLGIVLSRKKLVATVSALFFSVSFVSNQAVTWMAALGTVLATFFILWSLIFYLKGLFTNKASYFIYSFLAFWFSLYFKEIGIFLVLFYPVLFLWYKKTRDIRAHLQANMLYVGYGCLMILFRLYELAFNTVQDGAFVTSGENFKAKLLVHAVLYPLTGVFQVFVPPLTLYAQSKQLGLLLYSYLLSNPISELVTQTIVADALCLLGSLILIVMSGLLYVYRKEKSSLFLVFSYLFTFMSFLPYAVLDRGGSYMDSRYYYLAAIGAGLILGYISEFLIRKHVISAIFTVLCLFFLIFMHAGLVREEINKQVELGIVRQKFLTAIQKQHPSLNEKTIFYFSSDKEYYIAGNPAPMQQGMGYTLLVRYYPQGSLPVQFLNENVLWNLGTQGYVEIDHVGFGYFSDFATLQQAYNTQQFTKEDIVAFYWDSKSEVLHQNTEEVKAKLE